VGVCIRYAALIFVPVEFDGRFIAQAYLDSF
jgi:hypothetical protein